MKNYYHEKTIKKDEKDHRVGEDTVYSATMFVSVTQVHIWLVSRWDNDVNLMEVILVLTPFSPASKCFVSSSSSK